MHKYKKISDYKYLDYQAVINGDTNADYEATVSVDELSQYIGNYIKINPISDKSENILLQFGEKLVGVNTNILKNMVALFQLQGEKTVTISTYEKGIICKIKGKKTTACVVKYTFKNEDKLSNRIIAPFQVGEGIQGLGATALHEDTIAFNKAILKAKREGVIENSIYSLGKSKDILKSIIGEHEIFISGKVIKKAMTKDKDHILYWEDFINLPDKVNEPLAVFKSKTKKDSFVILTEIINYKEKPVIVPIRIFRKGNFLDIRSLYSRVNSNNTYKKWGESGLALYVNKESNLSFKVFKGTIPSVDDKPLSKRKTTKKSKTTKKDTEFFSGGMGLPIIFHSSTVNPPQNNGLGSVAPVVAAPMAVAPVASPQVMPTPQVPAIRPQAQPKTVAPKVPQTTAMTQIGMSDFDFFEVAGQEGEFLQLVEKKPVGSVVITIDGPQGAGKTTMLYRFMNSFAVTGNACLFLSLEEHPESFLSVEKRNKYLTPTAQSHISTVGELESLQQLYELIEPFDIIFIDSWQKLVRAVGNIRLDEDLRKKFNSKCFVIIFQQTVTGRTKGGAEIVFDGDIIIKMMKAKNFDENYAFFDKNRYTRTAIHLLRYNIASGVVYNPELQQEMEDIEYEEVY